VLVAEYILGSCDADRPRWSPKKPSPVSLKSTAKMIQIFCGAGRFHHRGAVRHGIEFEAGSIERNSPNPVVAPQRAWRRPIRIATRNCPGRIRSPTFQKREVGRPSPLLASSVQAPFQDLSRSQAARARRGESKAMQISDGYHPCFPPAAPSITACIPQSHAAQLRILGEASAVG
jgi:hypothetical protein